MKNSRTRKFLVLAIIGIACMGASKCTPEQQAKAKIDFLHLVSIASYSEPIPLPVSKIQKFTKIASTLQGSEMLIRGTLENLAGDGLNDFQFTREDVLEIEKYLGKEDPKDPFTIENIDVAGQSLDLSVETIELKKMWVGGTGLAKFRDGMLRGQFPSLLEIRTTPAVRTDLEDFPGQATTVYEPTLEFTTIPFTDETGSILVHINVRARLNLGNTQIPVQGKVVVHVEDVKIPFDLMVTDPNRIRMKPIRRVSEFRVGVARVEIEKVAFLKVPGFLRKILSQVIESYAKGTIEKSFAEAVPSFLLLSPDEDIRSMYLELIARFGSQFLDK